MNYKPSVVLILIALVASVLLSGCIENTAPAKTTSIPMPLKDVKYIGDINGMEIYQVRIDSINATCVYGTTIAQGTARSDVLDCKYD